KDTLRNGVQDGLKHLMCPVQFLFRPLALSDVIERSYKASASRSIGRDGEPYPQGFNFDLESLWLAGQDHSTISLKQIPLRLADPRHDLGNSLAHCVFQACQLSKCTVDSEV